MPNQLRNRLTALLAQVRLDEVIEPVRMRGRVLAHVPDGSADQARHVRVGAPCATVRAPITKSAHWARTRLPCMRGPLLCTI